jgi:muramoyltetrapeptide carboxypeptidase
MADRRPPLLQPGDRIAVAAPARFIDAATLAPVIEQLQARGYEVVTDPILHEPYHQCAGRDEERAAHLNRLLNDTSIRAIWFARGGYGSMRIVDYTDWEALENNPKWLIGFSDITVLLASAAFRAGVMSVHGPMPYSLGHPSLLDGLFTALETGLFHCEPPLQNPPVSPFSGVLRGGNLSLLYAMQAAGDKWFSDGDILFIEDLDEYQYHIDRMALALYRAGVFHRAGGILLGGLTDMKDHSIPFGEEAEAILRRYAYLAGTPCISGVPAGHIPHNHPLVMGAEIQWDGRSLIQEISH